jgi:two-component system sensor histidine kinase UhpB
LLFFGGIVALFVIGLIVQRGRHSRAQEVSRKSEERSFLALASSTDGLWNWNVQADIFFCSDRFREILGITPTEIPGTMETFRSRLHPEDLDVTWSAIERHLEERTLFKAEFRLRTSSGSYLWFLSRGQAIWDSAGKAVRMTGWIQDITERKEAEIGLQAAIA